MLPALGTTKVIGLSARSWVTLAVLLIALVHLALRLYMVPQYRTELGGKPDFSPDSLTARSHAAYDDSSDLKAMIKANLIAERVAIEIYSQIIALIGDRDSTTRRLLEDILSDEQEHADELSDWLAD